MNLLAESFSALRLAVRLGRIAPEAHNFGWAGRPFACRARRPYRVLGSGRGKQRPYRDADDEPQRAANCEAIRLAAAGRAVSTSGVNRSPKV